MIDIKEIRKLSVEELSLMVEEIWGSIAEDTSSELKISEEEKQEILKRMDEYKSGKQKTY